MSCTERGWAAAVDSSDAKGRAHLGEQVVRQGMNAHQVTLNGRAVAVGRDHFKLLTMVCSIEHHDGDGNNVTTHEHVMEGVDAFGTVATKFVPPVPLKSGDVIQILTGETHEVAQPNAG